MRKYFIYCLLLFSLTSCINVGVELHDNMDLDEQFEYVLHGEGAKKLAEQDLKIIEIQEIDKSSDEDSVEEHWIPDYNQGIDHINDFVLKQYCNLDENYQSAIQKRREALLKEAGDMELELKSFKIKWDYKGDIIISDCIACDLGIVYDNIISNIRYAEVLIPEAVNNDCPVTKSRTEDVTDVGYSYSTPVYRYVGVFGRVLAEAYCTISATGRRLSDGVYLDDYDSHAYHYAESGYYADAQVVVTDFKPGLNGYVSFAYVAGYGMDSRFEIKWNGLYFSISGETNGHSGSTTISAQKLQ